jgi:hypothetical protein
VAYTREAAMKSLNNTLNQINAAQSAKGFSGDSFGNRMMTYGAQNQAQGQIAGANLANLQTVQGIQNTGLQTALQNAMLPYQVGQAAGQYQVMPQNIYSNAALSALQPLSFLKIGTGTPPTLQPLPVPGPIPGGGQMALQGLSSLGGVGMNYALGQASQNNAYNNMMQMLQYGNGAGGGFNPLSVGSTPYLGYASDVGALGGGMGGGMAGGVGGFGMAGTGMPFGVGGMP